MTIDMMQGRWNDRMLHSENASADGLEIEEDDDDTSLGCVCLKLRLLVVFSVFLVINYTIGSSEPVPHGVSDVK